MLRLPYDEVMLEVLVLAAPSPFPVRRGCYSTKVYTSLPLCILLSIFELTEPFLAFSELILQL